MTIGRLINILVTITLIGIIVAVGLVCLWLTSSVSQKTRACPYKRRLPTTLLSQQPR